MLAMRIYKPTDSLIYKNIDLKSDKRIVFLSGLGLGIRNQREGFFRRFALTSGVSYLALDYTGYASQFSIKENFRLDTVLSKTLDILQNTTEELLLCGMCYGGALAMQVGAQMPNRIGGMVMLAPLYETKEYHFFEQTSTFLKRREERLKNRQFDFEKLKKLILFRQMIQVLAKSEQRTILSTYQGPVHIFHGEKDNLVPLNNSYHVQRALENPNIQVHPIEGAGHNLIPDFKCKCLLTVLKSYLEREN